MNEQCPVPHGTPFSPKHAKKRSFMKEEKKEAEASKQATQLSF
jgi:hypothetical protein